jgi:hypothetical protein
VDSTFCNVLNPVYRSVFCSLYRLCIVCIYIQGSRDEGHDLFIMGLITLQPNVVYAGLPPFHGANLATMQAFLRVTLTQWVILRLGLELISLRFHVILPLLTMRRILHCTSRFLAVLLSRSRMNKYPTDRGRYTREDMEG